MELYISFFSSPFKDLWPTGTNEHRSLGHDQQSFCNMKPKESTVWNDTGFCDSHELDSSYLNDLSTYKSYQLAEKDQEAFQYPTSQRNLQQGKTNTKDLGANLESLPDSGTIDHLAFLAKQKNLAAASDSGKSLTGGLLEHLHSLGGYETTGFGEGQVQTKPHLNLGMEEGSLESQIQSSAELISQTNALLAQNHAVLQSSENPTNRVKKPLAPTQNLPPELLDICGGLDRTQLLQVLLAQQQQLLSRNGDLPSDMKSNQRDIAVTRERIIEALKQQQTDRGLHQEDGTLSQRKLLQQQALAAQISLQQQQMQSSLMQPISVQTQMPGMSLPSRPQQPMQAFSGPGTPNSAADSSASTLSNMDPQSVSQFQQNFKIQQLLHQQQLAAALAARQAYTRFSQTNSPRLHHQMAKTALDKPQGSPIPGPLPAHIRPGPLGHYGSIARPLPEGQRDGKLPDQRLPLSSESPYMDRIQTRPCAVDEYLPPEFANFPNQIPLQKSHPGFLPNFPGQPISPMMPEGMELFQPPFEAYVNPMAGRMTPGYFGNEMFLELPHQQPHFMGMPPYFPGFKFQRYGTVLTTPHHPPNLSVSHYKQRSDMCGNGSWPLLVAS